MPYILSIDQGTTSSRALLIDKTGDVIAQHQVEFTQHFPKPTWVEHDANEIWSSQLTSIKSCIEKAKIDVKEIKAIGITNQRETIVAWNNTTGIPIYNAIVWQDRRTVAFCKALKNGSSAEIISHKTGLVIDAYFSASKIKWILENVPEAKILCDKKELNIGTIDSFLIWKLTNGAAFSTDYSNASRTMLFNIIEGKWDQELLDIFNIPMHILPEVKESSGDFSQTAASILGQQIPIRGVAGDQQAALFGHQCLEAGMIKNTYGTGCFMLMNTGNKIVHSTNGLLSTIAWKINGQITYALEGSVFIGGAVIQWLRDQMQLIKDSKESEVLANAVEDTAGVYFVPAFVGLGTPYWNAEARGTISGLTRGTNRNHIVRAALEAIAYQSNDVINVMQTESGIQTLSMRVDGGATANNFLMQFQSDISNLPIERPDNLESTAMGAAFLAGLAINFWTYDDLSKINKIEKIFKPQLSETRINQLIEGWEKAIQQVLN